MHFILFFSVSQKTSDHNSLNNFVSLSFLDAQFENHVLGYKGYTGGLDPPSRRVQNLEKALCIN